MDMIKAYELIQHILTNKIYKACGIADELIRKHPFIDREDLINDLYLTLTSRKSLEIRELKGFLITFCYRELMNKKRFYIYRETSSIEEFKDEKKLNIYEYLS